MQTAVVVGAIALGLGLGLTVVVLIALYQGSRAVNSLLDAQDLVGAIVTVRLPLDAHTPGSVWVVVAGQRLVLRAVTQDTRSFAVGDRAVIVEVGDRQVWVVHLDQTLSDWQAIQTYAGDE